ncbi:MAG: sigma-70 family RNA polymerase sigma factor [Marinobacter sp.]|uniref:sigma-70 family RNA polymerase sigma factor n=1 Tax=Marinobacter sp. TaxID=50741 RepID=UPI003C453C5D
MTNASLPNQFERSENEDRALAHLVKQGDEARERLRRKYEAEIASMAASYSPSQPLIEDLIAEGVLALDRAMRKFNQKLKLGFEAYARIWIKSAMESYITKFIYRLEVDREMASKAINIHKAMAEDNFCHESITQRISSELKVNNDYATKMVALSNAIQQLAAQPQQRVAT